jgi:hypothetical protein
MPMKSDGRPPAHDVLIGCGLRYVWFRPGIVDLGGWGTTLEPHSVIRRRTRMKMQRRVNLMLVTAMVGFVGGCGSSPYASDLPRTTSQGITITVFVSEEVLPLPGCHTQWLMSHDEEPPPGTCEQTMTVRRFIAENDGERVETSVVGESSVDPLYAMGLAARNLTEGISIVVVDPPTDAAVARLTDGSGEVIDEVVPSDGLVALAGFGSGLTAEAIATDGTLVAKCPPQGVLIEGVIFECTLAADATVPVTTVPTETPNR